MSTERDPDDPGRIVPSHSAFDEFAALSAEIASCKRCPRLVSWREKTARLRPSLSDQEPYWARGVPGFGDVDAKLLVVGLAPAAQGANRTGRMFTGDRSGTFLFSALYRHGYANQPFSSHLRDGLELKGVYVTAAVRCAPPANLPSSEERSNCAPYLSAELALLRRIEVILALGAFAFDATLRQPLVKARMQSSATRPRFAHGLQVDLSYPTKEHGPKCVMASYHPSQRNVYTGLLTTAAFDAIFDRIRDLLG